MPHLTHRYRAVCTIALALLVLIAPKQMAARAYKMSSSFSVSIVSHKGNGCTLLNAGGKILPELDLGTKTGPSTPFTLSWQLFDPTEDGSLPFMAADFLKERPRPTSGNLVKPCRVRVRVASEAKDSKFQLVVSSIKVPYYWLLEHDNHIEHSAKVSASLRELGESHHSGTVQATTTDDDALLFIQLAPSFGSSCASAVEFDYTVTTMLQGYPKTKTQSVFAIPSLQPLNGTLRRCS